MELFKKTSTSKMSAEDRALVTSHNERPHGLKTGKNKSELKTIDSGLFAKGTVHQVILFGKEGNHES